MFPLYELSDFPTSITFINSLQIFLESQSTFTKGEDCKYLMLKKIMLKRNINFIIYNTIFVRFANQLFN